MADISRADVATLIQEEYSSSLLTTAAAESAVLSVFENVPLGTKITNLPVLAGLPEASWVTESVSTSAGTKPTSEAIWDNKKFVVEEVAVIIPIHEDVLEDSTENLLESLTKLGGAALGKKLDQAVLFGLNKPSTWTDLDLLAAATAAGNIFQIGATAGTSDLGGQILNAAGAVADSGGEPSALLSGSGLRYRLANLRDSQGGAVFTPGLSNALGSDDVFGLKAGYAKNGSWNNTLATAMVVDAGRVKIGVRQDVTVKFLDQATVNGINLAEKDMVALRFKARYAYALGNVLTANGTAAEPVAAITPAA
ncbi:Phage capsid family protein [compost metagenome]